MLIVTVGFQGSLSLGISYGKCSGDCSLAVDKMWRVLIGFGAVPACIALYYRLTIPETPRYTFDVARDVEQAGEDVEAYMTGKHMGNPDELRRLQTLQESSNLTTPKASWGDFLRYYGKWKNGKILLGTAGSWFVLDVAFYGLNLNSSTVLGAIHWTGSSTDNVYQQLYKLAVGNIILTCAGAIPGYWFSVATIDTIGRRPVQMMGFVILTILFLVWGFDYWNLSPGAMFGIYVVAQFFFNFGKAIESCDLVT
jgi:PHS family inorganic phosphate transporter-like MFS transporter